MSNKSELLRDALQAFGVNEYNEEPAQKFLENHPWLLKTELDSGLYTNFSQQEIYAQITLPSLKRPDFVRREWTPSSGWIWEFIEIEPPGICPLNKNNSYSPRLSKALAQVYEWQRYADHNPSAMREQFTGFTPPLFGRIIVGRSDLMSPAQRTQWNQIRNAHQHITIRTYTWLTEKLSSLREDIIERAVSDGTAKGLSDLVHDRRFMIVRQNQPYSTRGFGIQIRIQEIRGLVDRFRTLAGSGEFPRAEATAFENLVKNALPNLEADAQEIREIMHDLDMKEPNVTVNNLAQSLDRFIARLGDSGDTILNY